MDRLKIFLASSITELHNIRNELGNFIRSVNDILVSDGMYVNLQMCEDVSSEIVRQEEGKVVLTRKQNQYNEMIRQSDYFFIMFKEKAGEYTKEEYNIAKTSFNDNNSPKINVFFIQHTSASATEADAFRNELSLNGEDYSVVENIEAIKHRLLSVIKERFGERVNVFSNGKRVYVNDTLVKTVKNDETMSMTI